METNKILQDIKQGIADIFVDYQWEFNREDNWNLIKKLADDLLDTYKNSGKIYRYQNLIVQDNVKVDSGKLTLSTYVKLDKDSDTYNLKTEITVSGIINSDFN